MANPTAPTVSSICSEALLKIYTDIPTDIQNRAETQWMDELKSEIMLNINNFSRKLKPLYMTVYSVLQKGLSRYDNPADYSSDLTLTVLEGTYTGIAQAGAANSITLAAAETITEVLAVGKYVLMTSGTSLNSYSQITAYNITTKVATVSPAWVVNPVSGDGYMIVDSVRRLYERNADQVSLISPSLALAKPERYHPQGNSTYGEFLLTPIPDKTYGLRMQYFIDLLRIDLTSTLISTLYLRWRIMWVQGIYVKALQNIDDPNADKEKQLFLTYTLPNMLEKEGYRTAQAAEAAKKP